MNLDSGLSATVTGVSWTARVFALVCGIALCSWTAHKLRRRTLLISICSLLIAIGAGLITFAAAPGLFDRLSYALGVKYPPLLYLILAILGLLVLMLHLAARLSIVDERCRRLAQELALWQYKREHEIATRDSA